MEPASRPTFGPITTTNVGMLRVLNTVIFPVHYNDNFYIDIVETPRGLSKYGYIDGMAVGAICCRIETTHQGRERVYIMTLGVLAAYRQQHVGTALLESVLEYCAATGMDHIYLHVQTSNAAAIRFYLRLGFKITQTIHNYYKHIEPPDCYILAKSFPKSWRSP
ncbi:acetyltransferase, GNAT family protein [Achlya hypogyna]|uniref:Acetyltransferase, GNAT family protein n=1 Tax=Achlya hypogyna TaxID=1202772 RepID=A0A1V9Z2Q1_ACHHY|nr:acetyltransferase, GNAT family protein [Achlya hypogyna]